MKIPDYTPECNLYIEYVILKYVTYLQLIPCKMHGIWKQILVSFLLAKQAMFSYKWYLASSYTQRMILPK